MRTTVESPILENSIFDAILWVIVPLGVLWWVHVGGFSGDGIAQSLLYANGSWKINPNHLLYEPLGSAWLGMFHVAKGVPAIDHLKRLSFLGGALTTGLFRLLVSSRVARTRLEANLATAWVIVPAALLGLWLSDETEIIQLPALVLLAATVIHFAIRPKASAAVLIGMAGGLAGLFYISNIVICVAVVVVLCSVLVARGDTRRALHTFLMAGLGGAIVVLPVMLGAWYTFTPHTVAFSHWLTSYGGDKAVPNGAAGYGIDLSLRGIGTGSIRAAYGSANALVDISGAISSAHDAGRLSAESTASVVVLLLGACAVIAMLMCAFRQKDPTTRLWFLPLCLGWSAGVMAFAVYWNNSDDQFFFQLALPLAVTAAVSMRTRMRPALVGFLGLFGWNAYATVWHYVTYPRQRNVEILAHESNTTALLIFPGEDDISSLLAFVPKPSGQERIAITGLAEQLPARDGLAVLRDSVNAVVQRGGIVTAISVIDAPVDQNPWKYLRSLGYEHSMVTSTLTSVAILCQARTVGPWSSRLAVRKSPPSRAPCPKESASQ